MHVVTYGIVGVPRGLDPHDQTVPNDFATRVAFDSLLMPEDDGGLRPWLAESYRAVDADTWDFQLRSGVRFASGRPLDAAAVVWNFQRLQANPRLLVAARIPTLATCEATDALTVRFRTRGPDVIWPRRVLQVVIADPQELGTSDPVPDPGPGAGTGLFQVIEFDPARAVLHAAVPDTWRGTARLGGLRTLPFEPSALLAALRSGEADFGYLSGHDVATAQQSGLVLQRILQSNVHMIRFNSTRPPFDDPQLRAAVSLALDPRRIVAERYLGEGRAPDQVVGTDCFGHVPGLPPHRVDVDEARRLAAAVSVPEPLRFDVLASSAVLRPWCDASIAALAAVGIPVEAAYVDLPTYLGKLAANQPPRGDLIGAGNQYGPGLDAEFALNKFSRRLPVEQVEYDNPAFQALYDASQVEFDQTRRRGLLQDATRLLLNDHGCVPVYQPALSWLVNPRVTGLRMNTIGAGWVDWKDVTCTSP